MKKIIKYFTDKILIRRFLKNSIPINTHCILEICNKKYVCFLEGYVVDTMKKSFFKGLPVCCLVSMKEKYLDTKIQINTSLLSFSSLKLEKADYYINTFNEKGVFCNENLNTIEIDYKSEKHYFYIVVSIDRLTNKTLYKIEKKKYEIKIPVNDQR